MSRNVGLRSFEKSLGIYKTLGNGSMDSEKGYALKNWVEGLSDEAYYPWESLKKFD